MGRDLVLDYAKGIGIILMVIGHCYSEDNIILTLIYGFHMAFFFVISGIIYGRKSICLDFRFSSVKIIKSLLIPYFIYELIFSVFLSILDRNHGFLTSLTSKIISVVMFKGITATWYLPCIVFVELTFLYLYKKIKIVVFPISFGMFLLGIFVAPYVENYAIVLVRCIIGLGFFALGFLIGRKGQNPNRRKVENQLLPIFSVVYIIFASRNGMVSLVSLKLSNPIFYVCNAIVGTIAVLMLSDLVARCAYGKKFKFILSLMGRNTLFILGTHMLLVEVIRLLDYKLVGSFLPKLGLGEGIVLGLLVCAIEYAALPSYQKFKSCLNQKYEERTHRAESKYHCSGL